MTNKGNKIKNISSGLRGQGIIGIASNMVLADSPEIIFYFIIKQLQVRKKFILFKINFSKQIINDEIKNSIILIAIIIVSSLLLRLYFFPFGIPLTLDSIGYFLVCK